MKKWDYKIAEKYATMGEDDFLSLLKMEGLHGWELVSVCEYSEYDIRTAYLKRERI